MSEAIRGPVQAFATWLSRRGNYDRREYDHGHGYAIVQIRHSGHHHHVQDEELSDLIEAFVRETTTDENVLAVVMAKSRDPRFVEKVRAIIDEKESGE